MYFRFQLIYSLGWDSVALFFIWLAVCPSEKELDVNWAGAPWCPGLRTTDGHSVLSTSPFPASTPLEGFVFVLFCFFLGFFFCLFYFLESRGMQKHKCQFKGKANDWKHGVGFLCFCFFFSSDYVIPSSALGALTMVGYQFWGWGGVLPCLFQIL